MRKSGLFSGLDWPFSCTPKKKNPYEKCVGWLRAFAMAGGWWSVSFSFLSMIRLSYTLSPKSRSGTNTNVQLCILYYIGEKKESTKSPNHQAHMWKWCGVVKATSGWWWCAAVPLLLLLLRSKNFHEVWIIDENNYYWMVWPHFDGLDWGSQYSPYEKQNSPYMGETPSVSSYHSFIIQGTNEDLVVAFNNAWVVIAMLHWLVPILIIIILPPIPRQDTTLVQIDFISIYGPIQMVRHSLLFI